jgi:hypothetical protein
MRVKKRDEGGTAFADLVHKPIVLIEMKKRRADLRKHYRQAFDYWVNLNFRARDALITEAGLKAERPERPQVDVINGNLSFIGVKFLKPQLGEDFPPQERYHDRPVSDFHGYPASAF